jgi:hypothetical protein
VPESNDQICGVDRDIIEKFLTLIKERYQAADEANYFLEEQVGVSSINTAITNQRDALSHLGTILTNPSLPRAELEAQIAKAAEHLHRSIFETYETAVNIMLERVLEVYGRYKKNVITLSPPLHSAPSIVTVDLRLKTVKDLKIKARAAKGKNSWNAEALEGIQHSVKAVLDLKVLIAELEQFIVVADGRHGRTESRRFGWVQIAIGLGGLAIGVVGTWIAMK